MTAGSGLLLPTVDELVAQAGRRRGVTAVLDAADAAHRQLEDAEYRASFAPPPTYYAQCVCGAVMQIHGDLVDEDYDAIRDFDDAHSYCSADRS